MTRLQLPPGSWGIITPRELATGVHEVRVQFRRLDGTSSRKKFRGKSKTAVVNIALKELPELVGRVYSGSAVSPNMSFTKLAEMWIDELKSNAANERAWHEEVRLITVHIIPKLGKLTVREVKPSTVMAFHQEIAKRTPSQARNVMVPLRKICRLGVQLDLMSANPGENVGHRKAKVKEIHAPSAMELDELREKIIEYRISQERPGPKQSLLLEHVVEAILGTSGRIGEIVGLRWSDVDLLSEPPTVTFNGSVAEGRGQPKQWQPSGKSTSFNRCVPIPDFLVEILKQRSLQNDGAQYVFATRTGAPNGPQDVHRALRRVREWAGITEEMVPHSLRKSVATTIAQGQGGLIGAAQTLGHAQSRVTEKHYAKRATNTPDHRADLNRIAPGASRVGTLRLEEGMHDSGLTT